MTRSTLVIALVAATLAPAWLRAQAPTPAYIAIGDSIEFGVVGDPPHPIFSYVPLLAAFLSTFYQQPIAPNNFSEPGAQSDDILHVQLPQAVAAMAGHAPIVVSWGGGGNDLIDLVLTPQAAACRQSESCLGRFNGLLNHIEQGIDHTIRELREAAGPGGIILMRTVHNGFLRTGCRADAAALASVTLEGLPGTVLEEGLNDRIRSIAQKYSAQVVDLFLPFAIAANSLVGADCVHPTVAGYQAIAALSTQAFLAAQ